jgi:excisionase family DNA binding protein
MVQQNVPDLLTVPEAQNLLRTSRSTVYRMMAEKRLAYVAIGDMRRIPLDAVLEFIKANTISSVAS